jgi:hypothetical protein
MGSTTTAGTELAISGGTPAGNTEAAIKALTYTVIGNVESLGAFGATNEVTNFQPLKGELQKYKGPRNSGAIQPSMAHDDSDAGQTLFRTAADDQSQKLYYFKVTYPDGAMRHFGARVFGYPENVGGANTMLMANPSVEISTPVYKTAAV